jgi:hypothetical protein
MVQVAHVVPGGCHLIEQGLSSSLSLPNLARISPGSLAASGVVNFFQSGLDLLSGSKGVADNTAI